MEKKKGFDLKLLEKFIDHENYKKNCDHEFILDAGIAVVMCVKCGKCEIVPEKP